MKNLDLRLSARQAEQLLNQLPMVVKIYLVRRWEKETWPQRFRLLLERVDKRLEQNPRVAQDALNSVGPARRAFYAARRNRH